LKQLEDSPSNLKRADVRFDDMELCTIILTAIPYRLACAYWAKYPSTHFPMNVADLSEDLVLLEPMFGQTQKIVAQIRSQGGTNNPGEKGKNQNGKRTLDQPIPKKTAKGVAPKNGRDDKKRKGNKFCSKCAKYAPHAQNSHNTNECRRFDENGKDLFAMKKRERNVNAVAPEMPDIAKCFAQMQKDNSKLLKLLKKKKAKRSRIVDSSDSSDSE